MVDILLIDMFRHDVSDRRRYRVNLRAVNRGNTFHVLKPKMFHFASRFGELEEGNRVVNLGSGYFTIETSIRHTPLSRLISKVRETFKDSTLSCSDQWSWSEYERDLNEAALSYMGVVSRYVQHLMLVGSHLALREISDAPDEGLVLKYVERDVIRIDRESRQPAYLNNPRNVHRDTVKVDGLLITQASWNRAVGALWDQTIQEHELIMSRASDGVYRG